MKSQAIYLNPSKAMKKAFLFYFFILISLLTCVEASDWKRVYLATYPRSGNHWMRYLIEEVTHIATGSTYRDTDPQHLERYFPWGGYSADHGYVGNCRYPTKKDIVVIKTHFPAMGAGTDILKYQKIIRIVRHPVDSIYSHFVFKKDNIPEKIPREDLASIVNNWKKYQKYWNKQENVYTFRYEDLLKNPTPVLKQVLKTIGYRFTNEDILRAVQKHPPIGYELKHLKYFTESDLAYIKKELGVLMDQFGYQIP